MKLYHVVLLGIVLALFGCSKGADTETPVAELEQEAESMSVEQLQDKAKAYQEMISQKLQELEPIQKKLMEIPLAQKMGDEATAVQAELATLQDDLSALKERLNVYVEALKEKGESAKEYLN